MVTEAELKRRREQKADNIKEVSNEVRIITDDLNNCISAFKDMVKPGKYERIRIPDIAFLLKKSKYLAKSVQTFLEWFEFWKEKDWHDK